MSGAQTAIVRWPIAEVKIGERRRREPSDLDELGQSIKQSGLHHPVVLTGGGDLVSGYRRLKACAGLGLEDIPAYIPRDLDEAAALMRMEREEGTCAALMMAAELVTQVDALRLLPLGVRHRRALDALQDAIGMSGPQYVKVKRLADVARTECDPDKRSAAHAALSLVDRILAGERVERTGSNGKRYALSVSGVFRNWDASRHDPEFIRANGRRVATRSQRSALAAGIASLNGLTAGFATVERLDPNITAAEAVEWAAGVARARRVLRTLHTTLKEHADATR